MTINSLSKEQEMGKHTPGPWYFAASDQYGQRYFYVAQADGAPYTPHYSDVATVIAETCQGDMAAIQEANARLISAAPDLLEAIKAMVADFDGCYAEAEPAMIKARAAIAMAEGAQ